jgi:predicted ArsR family transcriptional regulator
MGRPPRNSATDVAKVIALHPEPVVASGDVHEQLGLTKDGALDRLNKLAEQGILESKNVGASGKVFWLADDGKEKLNEAF